MDWIIEFLIGSQDSGLYYSVLPMAAVGMGVKALSGIAGGIIGSGKRKAEEAAAQNEFDMAKQSLLDRDISDPTKNLENQYEDLTVSTKADEMRVAGQQQALANTLGSMKSAAGGSGIAALAQSIAGQQSQNISSGLANLQSREADLAGTKAQAADSFQKTKMQGDLMQREMQQELATDKFQMAGQRLGAAKAARAAATESLMGGVTSLAGAGIAGGLGGGTFMEDAGAFLESQAG
jgi:hypothetical protein